MNIRTRKLIGTVALLAFLIAYAFLAMLAAVVLQVNGGKVAEVLFYFVGGLAWVPPAAWIVSWMSRPDTPPPAG